MRESDFFKKYLKEKKISLKSEKDIRAQHLKLAREYGFEDDLRKIWNRYDPLYANAKEEDKDAISIMAMVELHRLFRCTGPLVVNGKEILPALPSYEEDYKKDKKL